MTLEPYQARYPTPFAVLGIRTAGELLTHIEYLPPKAAPLAPLSWLAEEVCRQVEHYLDNAEFRFDLPFEFSGTPFQCRVWREIHRIPSGRAITYLDIARKLSTAPRPVGGACGANRIPLVIPCHRVVGRHGLGGFMGASSGFPLEIKKWLLRHEGVTADERR
ncbi:MAG: cysteine methyltransferase [Betaproteobacteria bacterium RIFCSPLOWO2_12_FULL_62_13]|nr:MAG: cysteine methyltransferase [Betaproteobacteria bacterium RIFCSPLOWO2_12_FULL_62_13]